MNDRIGSAYKKTKLRKGRAAACAVFIITAAVAKLAGKGGDDGHMPVKSESISTEQSSSTAGIPDGAAAADKMGETDHVSHDAAIVSSQGADCISVIWRIYPQKPMTAAAVSR